jgi:predicted ATPase/transcriptional regulator with XRE-family HTH domain
MSWSPRGQPFGAVLKHYRLAASLSQEKLAEKARLTVSAIQNQESGRRTKPHLYTINQLIRALKLTEDEQAIFIEAATGEPMPGASEPVAFSPLLVPPTPLVGREQALSEISQLLITGEHRLVTITGVGGIGKTRLALAAGAGLRDRYTDGVAFVDLVPLRDPNLFPAIVSRALGLQTRSNHTPEQLVLEYLRPRRVLIVVDNFEHVRPAAAFLARILATCPDVAAIATSRASLGVRGERIYEVQTLDLPRGNPGDLDLLVQSPAVELFVARAADARSDFAVTPANAESVAEICRRLDGLPLAIELAAPWLRVLSPVQLLANLSGRLNRPGKGRRDLSDRQQTLRSTLDWSFDLLQEPERELFCRLGIFSGGCSLEAVDAVCNADHELSTDVIDLLESLVDQSLLRQEGGSEDVARFGMLHYVREYAVEQLTARGQLETLQHRHTTYFLQLAESASAQLRGPKQRELLVRLETEHANLRTAVSAARSGAERDTLLRLVVALVPFWVAHGHLVEGRDHLEQALLLTEAVDSHVRARALTGAGILAWNLGDYEHARMRLTESLAARAGVVADRTTADALKWLGNTATLTGHPLEAIDFYQRSSAIYEQIGDDSGVVDARANLGIIYRRTGRYADALVEAENCLQLRSRMGHMWGVASSHNNIGEIHRSRGDAAAAIPAYERAVAVWQALGDALGIALGLTGLGIALVEAGGVEEGLAHLRDAQARFQALQSTTYLPELHGFFAIAHLASGDIEAARHAAECSLTLARSAGARDQEAITNRVLGQIALASGDLRAARELLEASRQTLAEAGEIGELARTEALLQALLAVGGSRSSDD